MKGFKIKALAATAVALVAAGPALAQSNSTADYSSLTEAVDWSQAITALMAVAAVIAGILVIRKGVRFVLGMIKSG